MSACSDSQSTLLPFPSSPHWAPTTTTLAIRWISLCNRLYKHDPRGKPVSTFRDHAAPSSNHGRGRTHARQPHPIKDAALLGKPERGLFGAENRLQAFDIPQKS